jgi:hypothetical protein
MTGNMARGMGGKGWENLVRITRGVLTPQNDFEQMFGPGSYVNPLCQLAALCQPEPNECIASGGQMPDLGRLYTAYFILYRMNRSLCQPMGRLCCIMSTRRPFRCPSKFNRRTIVRQIRRRRVASVLPSAIRLPFARFPIGSVSSALPCPPLGRRACARFRCNSLRRSTYLLANLQHYV